MINGRNNSLNFLRLMLATAVICSHALGFGKFGNEYIAGKITLGAIAVYGFFAISGYLIAASADHNGVGRFLWQRFLRIFPGFWLCLIIMVVFFGSIAYVKAGHHPAGCGATCYLSNFGFPYFWHHASLRLGNGWHTTIPGTQMADRSVISNVSLWTLFYEFMCYLAVAVLAVTGLLKRRQWVLALTVAFWITEIVIAQHPSPYIQIDEFAMITFLPVFFTGSLLYLYRDKVMDSGWIAIACVTVLVASLWFPIGQNNRPNSFDIFALAIAYPLLWLGAHLPLQRVGSKNDYSYGVYLYGWPVATLLGGLFVVHRWGYVPFTLITILCVIPFALFSWWVVEKQALKLRRISVPNVIGSVRAQVRPSADAVPVTPAPASDLADAPGR